VPATITVQRVSPQRRCAALFYGRHDLELPQAQVALLGFAPRWAMGTKDVGNLQSEASHAGQSPLHRCQSLQWADHLAQDFGGYLGVKGGGLQFFVPKQHLDDTDVDLLLQQVCGKTVPQGVH